MSDYLSSVLEVPRKFTKDSTQLLQRCTKPDKREFVKITQAVGMGFLLMGFIGYFIKLIHIPINNIIVYVGSSAVTVNGADVPGLGALHKVGSRISQAPGVCAAVSMGNLF